MTRVNDHLECLAMSLFLSDMFVSHRLTYRALRPLAGHLFSTFLQASLAADCLQAMDEQSISYFKNLIRRFAIERSVYIQQAKPLYADHIFSFEPPPCYWQNRFYAMSSAPPFLYVRSKLGHTTNLEDAAVAVVGSRKANAYGLHATKTIVRDIVKSGFLTISGGAMGIDRAAHETALAEGGMTAVVLGHGVDLVYPAQNRKLFETIASVGWLLSEYRPGTKPRRHHFPARNRLIAGLSDCVIVTAAKPHSGSLITAGYAADQGKPVFAVPGTILTDEAFSTHKLIKEGAHLYTDISDLELVFSHLIEPNK